MHTEAWRIILDLVCFLHLQKPGVLLVEAHAEVKSGLPLPYLFLIEHRAGVDKGRFSRPLLDQLQLLFRAAERVVFLVFMR